MSFEFLLKQSCICRIEKTTETNDGLICANLCDHILHLHTEDNLSQHDIHSYVQYVYHKGGAQSCLNNNNQNLQLLESLVLFIGKQTWSHLSNHLMNYNGLVEAHIKQAPIINANIVNRMISLHVNREKNSKYSPKVSINLNLIYDCLDRCVVTNYIIEQLCKSRDENLLFRTMQLVTAVDNLSFQCLINLYDGIQTNSTCHDLFTLLIQNGCKIDEAYVNHVSQNSGHHCNMLIDLIMRYSCTDNAFAALCLSFTETAILNKIADIADKFDGNLTQQCMVNALNRLPQSRELVHVLHNKGLHIPSMVLTKICGHYTSQYKVNLLEALLYSYTDQIQSTHYRMLFPKITRRNYGGHHRIVTSHYKFVEQCADLLFKHGFVPTYDDIVYGIEHCSYAPSNLEQYGIPMTDDLIMLYYKHDIEIINSKLDASMVILHKHCLQGNPKKINSIMKQYNIVPDEVCMLSASGHWSYDLINVLINGGGKVSLNCIYEALFHSNFHMTQVGSLLLLTYDLIEEQYRSALNGGQTISEINSLMVVFLDIVDKKVWGNLKTVMPLMVKNFLLHLPDNINAAINKPQLITTLELVNEVKEDAEYEPNCLLMNQSIVISDTRIKQSAPPKVKQMFKKCKKVSFLDVKRMFIDHIQTHRLISRTNNKYIKLNGKMCKILDVKRGSYVHTQDLDLLVKQFYI